MKAIRALAAVAATLVTVGCSRGVDGTAAAPATDRPAEPGLIMALRVEDRSLGDDVVLLDADGATVRTVSVPGPAGRTRIMDNGKALLDTDNGVAVLDTIAGTLTPVVTESGTDLDGLDVHDLSWLGVADAGDWALLGNPEQGELALVNVRTGDAVAIQELLDDGFFLQATLNAHGTYLTVITVDGAAAIPTSNPERFTDLTPDSGPVSGATDANGSRYALSVSDGNGQDSTGRVLVGAPGDQQPKDTGLRARTAIPVGDDRLLIHDQGEQWLLVDGSGATEPLDLDIRSLVARTSTSLLVTSGEDREDIYFVDLADPGNPSALEGLAGMHPLRGVDGSLDGSTDTGLVVMTPDRHSREADRVTVVDRDKVRSLPVAPFDTTMTLRLPGNRLVLGSAGDDDAPATTTVLDLETGAVLVEHSGHRPVAAAPDGSAVLVTGKPGESLVLPVDGSAPVELNGLLPIGWATA